MPLAIHEPGIRRRNSTHVRRRWLFALALFPAPAGLAMAAGLQAPAESLLAIKQTAHTFIVRQITPDFPNHEIEVSDLDPRLNLAACDAPLEGFLPPGGRLPGNTTIGVRCPGGKPWTVYVPATVKAMRKVVITKRPILRGSAIGKDDIALEEREITGKANAYIFDPAHALGKIAKRPLNSSTAVKPGMLDAPLLVRRGQRVIILAQGTGIEVRMMGTALMDGSKGQLVRVKNTVSKRTIEGLVIKPGIIRVNM